VFAVRRNFITKSLVQIQRHFWRVSRHGRIPSRSVTLKWILDFNVHDNVSNRFAGSTRTVRIPENVESFEVCNAAESSALNKTTCTFAVHLK
jgi:hypothetical protein